MTLTTRNGHIVLNDRGLPSHSNLLVEDLHGNLISRSLCSPIYTGWRSSDPTCPECIKALSKEKAA